MAEHMTEGAPSLSRALPWILAGLGTSELENRYIGDELPPELKKINWGVGSLTGLLAANRATRTAALSSLPFKQLGLFGIGSMDKLRRQQQSLVDANLGVASINKDTARINRGNARSGKAMALAYLLPAILGGGGLAYYAYNHRKQNERKNRYGTVDSKGQPRGGKKIRIDIPARALPENFFQSLTNIDDDPRAYTRIMAKQGSLKQADILPTALNIAGEFTGVPSAARAFKEFNLAGGSMYGDDNANAARYGLAGVGNTAAAYTGMRGITYPLLRRLLNQKRLADIHRGVGTERMPFQNAPAPIRPLVSNRGTRWLRNQFTRFPTAANLIGNNTYRQEFARAYSNQPSARGASSPSWRSWHSPNPSAVEIGTNAPLRSAQERINHAYPGRGFTGPRQLRQALGLSMQSPIDRLYRRKFRFDPARFNFAEKTIPAFKGSPIANTLFDAFARAPKVKPTSIPGYMGMGARLGLNKMISGATRGGLLARRHPFITAALLSIPLAGQGVIKDQMQEGALNERVKKLLPDPLNSKGVYGIPLTGQINNLLKALGADHLGSPLAEQLRGELSDPWRR